MTEIRLVTEAAPTRASAWASGDATLDRGTGYASGGGRQPALWKHGGRVLMLLPLLGRHLDAVVGRPRRLRLPRREPRG